MNSIEQVNKSLNNIKVVLTAADGVIKNPSSSLENELSKQNVDGKNLAPILVTYGTAGLVSATGVATLSTGIAGILGTAGAIAISGPVGLAIGGTALLFGGAVLRKIIKDAQRARQEKDRLKNETIRKQQVIINKLKRQNELNQQEIKNLKEALSALEEILKGMNK